MNLNSVLNRLLMRDPDMAPNICYAQDGEDLVLWRMFEGQASGFYVDIGAHHPMRFSNTYLFYRRGWRGINIDAQPGSMRLFKKHRSGDINLECGIAGQAGVMPYFRFNEPALNTFDENEARVKNSAPYRLLDQIDLPVRRLDEVLSEYLPSGQAIDFMTVDVEGKDREVLASNDWNRFRPRFILAETLRTNMFNLAACPVVQLLREVGYQPVGKVYNTTFFSRDNT